MDDEVVELVTWPITSTGFSPVDFCLELPFCARSKATAGP